MPSPQRVSCSASCSVAATAAECSLLFTKQHLPSRSLRDKCCMTSFRTSSGRADKHDVEAVLCSRVMVLIS